MTHVDPKNNTRQQWILRMFIGISVIMFLRLAQFSLLEHDKWTGLARQQILRTQEIEPTRGKILANDGNTELAISQIEISLASDNIAIRSTHADISIASRLSAILDLPIEQIVSTIHSERNASWIKRNLSQDTFFKFLEHYKDGKLPGIHIKREVTRTYPQHPNAASIIGFARADREPGFDPLGPYLHMKGIEGLEKSYNSELTGKPGQFEFRVNRFGAPELNSYKILQNPTHGNDLVTTLDLQLQTILREELMKALIQNKALSSIGIIMEPATGSILACDSVENTPEHLDPEYRNMNFTNCWPSEARRNLSTAAIFEPGSIWKPIMMSIALEHELVTPGEIIPWSDPIVLGSKKFYDWKKFPPSLQLAEVLIYSSNVGIIQVSKRLFNAFEKTQVADEIIRMGFARRLPIDFPTRPSGRLAPRSWSMISIGAVAEGYELGVTLAQLAAFYSCIANGGNRVFPHFGKELRYPGSQSVSKELTPQIQEIVLSQTTTDFIRDAMVQCVDHGTGKNASLKEYGVIAGGKTATAKMLVGGSYASGKYRASFSGFFPAENPMYVMVVSVEDPSAGAYYGGSVAAPLFQNIGRRICSEKHGIMPIPLPKVE